MLVFGALCYIVFGSWVWAQYTNLIPQLNIPYCFFCCCFSVLLWFSLLVEHSYLMYELLARSCSNAQLPFFSSQPRKDSCHPHQLVLSRLKIDISCTIANFSWGYQQQESWLQFFTQTGFKNTLEITSLSSSKALNTIHSGLALSICFHQLFRIISSLLLISLDKLARIKPH